MSISTAGNGTNVRWFVDVETWDTHSPEWNNALAKLPLNEQQQVTRFVFAKDQKLALASRLLQRKLIAELFGFSFHSITIARTPENKPYWQRRNDANLVAPAWWNYNVSHHGTVVAIASHPRLLIGVDVVQISERPRVTTSIQDFFRAFEHHFTPREWAYIRQSTDLPSASDNGNHNDDNGTNDHAQYHAFYRLWSLKEAYIKAVGIGLGFKLLRAEFFFDIDRKEWRMRLDGRLANEWRFESRQIHSVHLVSVAIGPTQEIWNPKTSSIFTPATSTSAENEVEGAHIEGEEPILWKEKKLNDLISE